MKVTGFTRQAMAVRKDIRDMERDGWEFVGEGGGRLWELERGGRWDHIIVDVQIAASGKGVWIKTAKRQQVAA